jgi:UDP-N-acetylmuramyl pentapeptide synthase
MTLWTAVFVLTIVASLSPLLTLLRLWQMKEWRWDRLIEHMRHDGILETLLSKSRVAIGGAWIIGGLGLILLITSGHGFYRIHEVLGVWPVVLPATLALLTVVQVITRRQPMPVWTQKARLSFIVSALLTVLVSLYCLTFRWEIMNEFSGQLVTAYPYQWLLLALPYLQPVIVTIAWILLRPIDLVLKRRIMARARAIRAAHPNLTVIGITGSVGKTTTKDLLSHILAGPDTYTTPQHVNTEMGVSAWISKILAGKPADAKATLIVEMGAYRIGEIALLCFIAQPTLGIITSIGEQHVALFGNLWNICRAKGELFAALPATGRAFLNGDSQMWEELKARAACPVTIIGTGGNGDVQAYDIEETRKGIRFTVDGTLVDVPLNGTHNVTNVLLAITCARHTGMPMTEIATRLRGFTPQKQTFEVRADRGVTVLDDTYNSSPQSFAAAIAWAERQPEGNKTLLISGIIELGDREADIHRELAAKAKPVFGKAYVTDERFLPYFKQGGFAKTSLLTPDAARLQPGDLLACVGRMPKSTIDRLLPS